MKNIIAILAIAFATFAEVNAETTTAEAAASQELIEAAMRGDLAAVHDALNKGADINAKRDDREGATALMWAAYRDHIMIVAALLEHGADIDATDNFGDTAFDEAKSQGNDDVLTFLRESRVGGTVTAEVPAKAEVEKPITYVGCFSTFVQRTSPPRVNVLVSDPIDSRGLKLNELHELFLLYITENHDGRYEYAICYISKSSTKLRIRIAEEVRELTTGARRRIGRLEKDWLEKLTE